MEHPKHAYSPEDTEKHLYGELVAALATNQEAIKKLDNMRTRGPESLGQILGELEQSNLRFSNALKKWLSYVRETGRRAD